jgi:hypothetical protein
MNTYIAAEFKKESFNCPLCGAFSHMRWDQLIGNSQYTSYYISICDCCSGESLWVANRQHGQKQLLPDSVNVPMPAIDMPDDVKVDYIEASTIHSRSPRGCAALLRLALQKLCIHLGEDGKNINKDIRSLSSKEILPNNVIKVADTLRITGNNAVHPGQMSKDDIDNVSSKMFKLINFIVEKSITEPKELKDLYELTPQSAREAAEKSDLS